MTEIKLKDYKPKVGDEITIKGIEPKGLNIEGARLAIKRVDKKEKGDTKCYFLFSVIGSPYKKFACVDNLTDEFPEATIIMYKTVS